MCTGTKLSRKKEAFEDYGMDHRFVGLDPSAGYYRSENQLSVEIYSLRTRPARNTLIVVR